MPAGSLRAVLGAALSRWAPAPRPRRFAFHYENVLGTSLELQIVATHRRAAARAESAALAEVDRLERILSGHSPASELARWQATHGTSVPVSPELAEVLEAGESWRLRTGGAFDPAAVSLVELLADATRDGASGAPREALQGRLRELNRPLWTVDCTSGHACRLTRLAFSLDALAKGYIVDRAAEHAGAEDGVSQVLVNIGGDLRHHGARELVVAVADPRAPAENAPPIAVVRIRNGALATSGGYRRGFVANGRRVSHILDPRTGEPAERIASASAFAPDCATADALSTAFSVMAPHESVTLADTIPGVGCLLVERDGTVTTNDTWNDAAVRRATT
jgi:thiamine biosynthesis lipoprotein